MKSINISCGQNIEYFSAERGDARNKNLVLNGYMNVEAKRSNILFMLHNGYVI
jgi:hypothetical protein